ncbi:dihydroxyacetone kinase subunit DhaK [Bacillus pseudomycoides]
MNDLQELYLFNNAVTRELSKRNIRINRTFVGNYMTSIDRAGILSEEEQG